MAQHLVAMPDDVFCAWPCFPSGGPRWVGNHVDELDSTPPCLSDDQPRRERDVLRDPESRFSPTPSADAFPPSLYDAVDQKRAGLSRHGAVEHSHVRRPGRVVHVTAAPPPPPFGSARPLALAGRTLRARPRRFSSRPPAPWQHPEAQIASAFGCRGDHARQWRIAKTISKRSNIELRQPNPDRGTPEPGT